MVVRKPPPPPSEEFEAAVAQGLAIRARCGYCHRTHFTANERLEWDEGEYEMLVSEAERLPAVFVKHTGSISTGDLDGKLWVRGCPCNSAARYEAFIVANASLIANYLCRRARALLLAANDENEFAMRAAEAAALLATLPPELQLDRRARDGARYIELD